MCTADTEGAATSTIRSASSASCCRVTVSAVEAKTIRTLFGKCWRKRSLRKTLSVVLALLPSSCCMRRSHCVGLRSQLHSIEVLLELPLLGGGRPLDELLLQSVIGLVCVWMKDQIMNFGSHLGGERRHDVIEFSFLYYDAPGGKLGIHLGGPRVSGPKWRDFEIDCGHHCPVVNCQCLPRHSIFGASVFFMHSRLSGSPGNVEYNYKLVVTLLNSNNSNSFIIPS